MNRHTYDTFKWVDFVAIIGFSLVYFTYPKMRLSVSKDSTPSGFAFNQQTHQAHGFGIESARIDSQITLKIPEGDDQAVYQYLRDTYADHAELLKKSFPAYAIQGKSQIDVSEFTDYYFDTPNLDLYKSKNSARHRSRINTTNLEDRKSGRELIQIKATPPGQFDLRTELKYKVKKNITLSVNKYLFMEHVKKFDREDVKKAFSKIDVDADRLQYVLTLHQTRSRVYLDWDGTNFLSFSVDTGKTNKLWATAKVCSVDIGLVEVAYTEADQAKRKAMWEVRDFIVQDLKNHFPGLTQNLDSKYTILVDNLGKKIPFFQFLIKKHII